MMLNNCNDLHKKVFQGKISIHQVTKNYLLKCAPLKFEECDIAISLKELQKLTKGKTTFQ